MFRIQDQLSRLLLLILFAVPVIAQNAPTFRIERIEVRGVRFASIDVIENEMRLVTGRAYSERELTDAFHRIKRLPFVLDAGYSLKEGSESGSHVMIVDVDETSPFFYSVEARHAKRKDDPYGTAGGEAYQVGGRWFLGRSTLVQAASDLKGHYELGITQYNVVRPGGFVSATARFGDLNTEGRFPDPVAGGEMSFSWNYEPMVEVRAGMPTFGNHAVHFHATRLSSESSFVGDRIDDRRTESFYFGSLAWLYDSTDSELFPTRGMRWRTGWRANYTEADFDDRVHQTEQRQTTQMDALFTEAKYYHPVSSNQSLIGGVSAFRSRYDVQLSDPIFEIDPFYSSGYGVAAGATTTLWPSRFTEMSGDLRLEATAEWLDFKAGNSLGYTAAIAQRNTWGIARLVFEYQELEFD